MKPRNPFQKLFDSARYPIRLFGGRDIKAGHLRGCGLEFGTVFNDFIATDPVFQAAFKASQDRGSVVTQQKLANLYLIIRYATPQDCADIHEFGSFSGGSAVFMGTVLKLLQRRAKVYAYDTFEGMPETDEIRDMHHKGNFANTGYAGLLSYIEDNGLGEHVETVKGEFNKTLPGILARSGKIALVHVDCDIYESTKYAVRECLPAMSAGAHIVFDDPLHGSCLGAFDAVQELLIRELGLTAEQAYPHLVFRYPALEGS